MCDRQTDRQMVGRLWISCRATKYTSVWVQAWKELLQGPINGCLTGNETHLSWQAGVASRQLDGLDAPQYSDVL